MTKDNEDALRCAEAIDSTHWPEREVAAHLRRLVAQNEAQAALLRQAVEALEKIMPLAEEEFGWYSDRCQGTVACEAGNAALAAIRQHLEGRA